MFLSLDLCLALISYWSQIFLSSPWTKFNLLVSASERSVVSALISRESNSRRRSLLYLLRLASSLEFHPLVVLLNLLILICQFSRGQQLPVGSFQIFLTSSVKSSLSNHHFSNLKLLLFGVWLRPESHNKGVWSLPHLGRALQLERGKKLSNTVSQKILSMVDIILEQHFQHI